MRYVHAQLALCAQYCLARDCLRVPGKQRLVSGGADGLLKVLEVASHAQ